MTFFQFEADFVDDLRCIPMQVRYKLDTCGVKLKLSHWHHLSSGDRQQLIELACETPAEAQAYRHTIHQMVVQAGRSGPTYPTQKSTDAGSSEEDSRRDRPAASATLDLPADLPIDPHPEWHNVVTIPTSVQTQCAHYNVGLTLQHWANLTPLQRFALIKLSRSHHENRNFLPALREFGVEIE